ncbi:MAG: NTP transferase domain-containing protein [Anaerolineales bacterium]
MNAFIMAGKVPSEDDPLFSYTRGAAKALVDIAGKPMVQWILDALNESEHVEQIAIVGLSGADGLHSGKHVSYIPDQGDMLLNALAGLSWVGELAPDQPYALFCSADIPSITGPIVDWRVETALESPPFDLDYVAVERPVMEARFPGSNRSYIRFRDVQVCGGDMNVIHVEMAVRQGIWHKIIDTRKSPLRQAALVGIDTLLLLLLRRLTLTQTAARVQKRLGLIGHAHLSPYAEIAMDVDKPHQLELMRRDLSDRS